MAQAFSTRPEFETHSDLLSGPDESGTADTSVSATSVSG